MKILLTCIAATLLFTATVPGPVMAQDDDDDGYESHLGYHGWGPRVGFTVDPDQIHFGAHMDLGNLFQRVRLQPAVELGLGDDFTIGEIAFEGHFRFSSEWAVWTPYAGGGPALLLIDRDVPDPDIGGETDTEVGLNVVGGIERGLSSGHRFFLEAQLGLVDAPDWKFTAGWTFF